MKILVVNGSPKGKNSGTLHTCLYLEKRHPEHKFLYLDAGRKVRSLERNFGPALTKIKDADMIVFCYPVYTFLVPSQLHRFIEKLKEADIDLSGKFATQVSTSMHFYDTTAHRYIEDNCADLGLKYIDGLSAGMEDILSPLGRKQAEDWFDLTVWRHLTRSYKRPSFSPREFQPIAPQKHTREFAKSPAKKAIVVGDFGGQDKKMLRAMVDRFVELFPYECDVVDIAKFPFQGGCVGCLTCAGNGKCVYKDGFANYLRGNIHQHDAIIYAFKIKDHSMGYKFKIFDDRQFCNGHRTVTMGTSFGYIIDGDYYNEENLRTILEARAQVGGNFLAGIATNDCDTDASLKRLGDSLCYALEHTLTPPQNFYGVGGMKIFRDLTWKMRGIMRMDHKFFKKHGQYDFPQKQWAKSLTMYLVGFLMNNSKLRAKMGPKITEGMIAPYRKMLSE